MSSVYAAQELLDSHKAWQASRFLYFLDVFTVAILPLSNIFSFFQKPYQLKKLASNNAPKIVNLDILIRYLV